MLFIVLVDFLLLLINRQRSRLLLRHCRTRALLNEELFVLLVIQIGHLVNEQMVRHQERLISFKMICTYTHVICDCSCMICLLNDCA